MSHPSSPSAHLDLSNPAFNQLNPNSLKRQAIATSEFTDHSDYDSHYNVHNSRTDPSSDEALGNDPLKSRRNSISASTTGIEDTTRDGPKSEDLHNSPCISRTKRRFLEVARDTGDDLACFSLKSPFVTVNVPEDDLLDDSRDFINKNDEAGSFVVGARPAEVGNRRLFGRSMTMPAKPRSNSITSATSSATVVEGREKTIFDKTDLPVETVSGERISLPCFASSKDSLRRISCSTLVDLINGNLDHLFEPKDQSSAVGRNRRRFQIVDCRYAYEYEGGHIKNAVNVSNHDDLKRIFLPSADGKECMSVDQIQDCILILHCEFSAERSPKMYPHPPISIYISM